jgi:hypothetical protein
MMGAGPGRCPRSHRTKAEIESCVVESLEDGERFWIPPEMLHNMLHNLRRWL